MNHAARRRRTPDSRRHFVLASARSPCGGDVVGWSRGPSVLQSLFERERTRVGEFGCWQRASERSFLRRNRW